MTLDEVKLRYVSHVLEECKGCRTAAAKVLDISIRSLRHQIQKFSKYKIDDCSEVDTDMLSFKFPSNAARIKHLNEPKPTGIYRLGGNKEFEEVPYSIMEQ